MAAAAQAGVGPGELPAAAGGVPGGVGDNRDRDWDRVTAVGRSRPAAPRTAGLGHVACVPDLPDKEGRIQSIEVVTRAQ